MRARDKYNGLQSRQFNWKRHFKENNLEELSQESDTIKEFVSRWIMYDT